MNQINVIGEKVNAPDIDVLKRGSEVQPSPIRFSLYLQALTFPRPVPSGGLIFQMCLGDRSASSIPLAFGKYQNGFPIELNSYKLHLEADVHGAHDTPPQLCKGDSFLPLVDSLPIPGVLRIPIHISMLDAKAPAFVHDAATLDIAQYVSSSSACCMNVTIRFLLGALLHATIYCCRPNDYDSCTKVTGEDLTKPDINLSLPHPASSPSNNDHVFQKEPDRPNESEDTKAGTGSDIYSIQKSVDPFSENSGSKNLSPLEKLNCVETKQKTIACITSSDFNDESFSAELSKGQNGGNEKRSSRLSDKRETVGFQVKQDLLAGLKSGNQGSKNDDIEKGYSSASLKHADSNDASNFLTPTDEENSLFCCQPSSFSKDLDKVPCSFLTRRTLSSDHDASNNATNDQDDKSSSTIQMEMNNAIFPEKTSLSLAENTGSVMLHKGTKNSTTFDCVEKIVSPGSSESKCQQDSISSNTVEQQFKEQQMSTKDRYSNTGGVLETLISASSNSDESEIYMDKENACKNEMSGSVTSLTNSESSRSSSSSDTDSMSTDSESDNNSMLKGNCRAFLDSSDSSDDDFESIGATIARRMREGTAIESTATSSPFSQLRSMNLGSSVTSETQSMDFSLEVVEDPNSSNENGETCTGRTLIKKRKSLLKSKSRKQRELSRDKEDPPMPQLTNKRYCGEHVSKYDDGVFKEQAVEMDLPTPNVLTFWMIRGPTEQRTKQEGRKIQIGKGSFAIRHDEEYIKSFQQPCITRKGPPARCGIISPLQKTVVRLRDPNRPPDFIDLGTPTVLHPSISQKLIGIMERNAGLITDDEQNPVLGETRLTDTVPEEGQDEQKYPCVENAEMSDNEDEDELQDELSGLMSKLGWVDSTAPMEGNHCNKDFSTCQRSQDYTEYRSVLHGNGNDECSRGSDRSYSVEGQEKPLQNGKNNRDGRNTGQNNSKEIRRVIRREKGREGESEDENGNDKSDCLESEDQWEDLSSLAKRRRYDSDVSSQTSNEDWREQEVRQSQGGLGKRCRRPSYDQVVNRSIWEVVEEFKPNQYVPGVTVLKNSWEEPNHSEVVDETMEERLFRRTVMCEGGVTQKLLDSNKVLIADLELEMEGIKEEGSKTEKELLYVIERLRCENYSLVDMVEERDNTLEEILQGNGRFCQGSNQVHSQREHDRREIERQTAYIDQMARQLQCERARCSGLSAENERLLSVVRRLADEIQEATTYMDLRRVIVESNQAVELERGERLRLEQVVRDLEKTIRNTSYEMHRSTQNARWWK